MLQIVTDVLKIALKEIPIISLVLELGKWDFHFLQKKLFNLSPKSDLWINMERNIL